MALTEKKTKSLSSIPNAADITRTVLPNGIVVLARANPHSLSVTVRGYLPAGGLAIPDEKLGLADFTAASLMHGTTTRDFQQIYDSLESIAATLGYSGGTHTTGFGGRALAEDLGPLLDLFADTLTNPTFPDEQVERLRAQMLTGLAMRAQDTRAMASLTFDELVYPNHPYGRVEEGNLETITAVTREDLENFHRDYFGPKGMVVTIVGGIDPIAATEQVNQVLGDWQNSQQSSMPELPQWQPLAESVHQRIEIAGKSQSDLVIGTAGPKRLSEHYMAAAVGNSVFGRFGMMGRIGDSVREKAGLAYYAYSGLGGGLGPSPWAVQAGVNPSNEEKASDLIFQEIKRFINELVTEEEISDSKSNFIGSMPLSLESNGGVAQAILNIERYDLGLDFYLTYPDLVNAVTREEIRDVAAHYLQPDQMAVAIAGPEREGN
jgi:zinc protease